MLIITALQRGRPSPSVPPLHDAPSNHVIHRWLIQDASSDGGKKQEVMCNSLQCKSMKWRSRYSRTQLHLKVEKENQILFISSPHYSLKVRFVWRKCFITKYWRYIQSTKNNFIELCDLPKHIQIYLYGCFYLSFFLCYVVYYSCKNMLNSGAKRLSPYFLSW